MVPQKRYTKHMQVHVCGIEMGMCKELRAPPKKLLSPPGFKGSRDQGIKD